MDADGILDVARQLDLRAGNPYSGKKWGPQVSISCPLAPWKHGDAVDYNKSCSVSIDPDGPSFARCHSFNCDYKGSFLNLIQMAVRRRQDADSFLEMLEWLLENDQDTIEIRARKAAVRIDENWAAINKSMGLAARRAPVADQDVLDESTLAPFKGAVPKYVFSRGLDLECCRVWELGYDRQLERLVFPVRDFNGRLIGVTGRILPSAAIRAEIEGYDVTKYHNYSGLAKTRHLYGAWLWKKERPLVLVEGPLDAARVWMALHHLDVNVGATLGQGFSDIHRRIVAASWPTAIYIFGDDDPAGRRMAEKVHDMLGPVASTFLMRCPREIVIDEETGEEVTICKDPGKLLDPEINHAYEIAEPILDQISW